MKTDNTSELEKLLPTILNQVMKGNYLLYHNYYNDGRDRLFFVVEYDNDNNNITLSDGSIRVSTDISNVKKIPFSDEMLLRLGFTKLKGKWGDEYHLLKPIDEKDDFFSESYFCVEHWNATSKDSKFHNNWFIKHTIKPHKVQYIHELQILFFALTGEHLILDKI